MELGKFDECGPRPSSPHRKVAPFAATTGPRRIAKCSFFSLSFY